TKETYWSKNYELLFGYELTNTEADFYNFEKCIHPADREKIFKSVEDLLISNENRKTLEYRFLKSNGEYAIVKDQAIVIRDTNGRAVRITGAMQDITQKKQEELQLRLFESAIKNTSECILITEAEPIDEPGPKIVFVNDAFTKFTGYKLEEVIGKTPRILQGPKTDRKVLDELKESLRNWRPHRFEIVNYKKNGEEFNQEIAIVPIADETGWFTHWVSVQQNVTERKKNEDEKEIFYKILTAINRNKTIEEGLQQILAIAGSYLCFDYAEAWTVNIDKQKVKYRTNWQNTTIDNVVIDYKNTIEAKKGEKLVGNTWGSGEIVCLNEVENNQLLHEYFTNNIPLVSGIGVPIIFNNEVVAVLTFFNTTTIKKQQISARILEKISTQIGTDIERKKTEDELNKFFALSPDLLCIIGFDCEFKKVNKATCDILEYSEDELLYQVVDNFIHPDYLAAAKNARGELVKGNALVQFENVYVTKNKKNKCLSWTCIPLVEEGIIYAVAEDITEKKRMDEEKKQLIDELTRNNTELKQFSYITSHNMRAPLTNLISIVNLLNTDKIQDERTIKLLNGFKTSTYQLNETLNDLINVLIIKERTNYNLTEINIKLTFEKVVASIATLIHNANFDIIYNFDLAETIMFGEQYLESIFLNLVTNSIKYAHPSRKGIINIHSYVRNKHTYIVFSDNGIGIDMKKAKNKIFGFHQKFHNHPESKGIGLYIVHAQITALGGNIDVDSTENKGTTFTLTFKNTH
ncbi:MAG: PAS domain S-box protein, partial [Chitinophagaceae bacterium]